MVYITTAKLNFLLIYCMARPYRTAKFKSVNILSIAILGSTTKFNSRQYFRLYANCIISTFGQKWKGSGLCKSSEGSWRKASDCPHNYYRLKHSFNTFNHWHSICIHVCVYMGHMTYRDDDKCPLFFINIHYFRKFLWHH